MSKPTKTNYNSLLIKLLGERPVLFNRQIGKLGGSAAAGLFLCHLLFWMDKGRSKDGWIYKTIPQFEEETCLTRSEQNNAIKRWKELGVLEVKLRTVPRKRFFLVNVDKLSKLLVSRNDKRHVQDQANQSAGFSTLNCSPELAITESTAEITFIDTTSQAADAPTRIEFEDNPFQNHD